MGTDPVFHYLLISLVFLPRKNGVCPHSCERLIAAGGAIKVAAIASFETGGLPGLRRRARAWFVVEHDDRLIDDPIAVLEHVGSGNAAMAED